MFKRFFTLFYLCIFLFSLESCQNNQKKNIVTIGFLDAFEDETIAQANQGFFDALEKEGFSEEKNNLKIIYRNAQGDIPILTQAADYMISQNVKLIATNPSISTITAIQNTQKIPIFMMVSPEPKIAGLENKQGKTPSNLLGVYDDLEYIGTSVKMIRELLPKAKKVGVIYNQAETQSNLALETIKKEAKKVNLEILALPVNNSNETQLVVQTLVNQDIDVFFAMPDNVVFASFEVIYKECHQAKIPIFTSEEGLVKRGAVAAYGADMYFWGYQAGEQAVQFLKTNSIENLKPEKVRKHKRVFNPSEAEFYNLKIDISKYERVGEKQKNIPQIENQVFEKQSFYLSALILGLAFAAMGLGIFISMRIFDIPDITTDGSYTLGAALTAVLLLENQSIFLLFLLVPLVGMIAGMITGFIHTKLKVNALLAGILVMTALYSINLILMGKSNLPLIDTQNIFQLFTSFLSLTYAELLVLVLVIFVLALALIFLLKTDFGLAMRATGDSETMIRANGVNTDWMKILGLGFANALIAISGSLVAQYQRFADINMGIGVVIIGLGSVMIGEALSNALSLKKIHWRILGVIIGTILFRMILGFTLALGIDPNLLKLVTAILVLIVVALPNLKK